MSNPVKTGVATGVVGGAVAYGAVVGLTAVSTQYLSGMGTTCIMLCSQNSQKLVEQGVPNLQKLENVATAVAKITDKGPKVGVNGINNFISATQKGTAYLDGKTGNINIFSIRSGGEGYLRITLNPEMTRVISAGLNKISNVINGIQNGRFVEIGSKTLK